MDEEALLLEHVPGDVARYKVSRGGRFLGWVERRGRWWYADRPDRIALPRAERRRRDALDRLTQLSSPCGA